MGLKTLTLRAPALVSWQLTRACNLACRHCCTDSAPGRALPDELDRGEALALARQIVDAGVAKVMLCGGEPTIVPHFFAVAELLGEAGTVLKIESNGQLLGPRECARLARLGAATVQISLDGDTDQTYARMRPGGRLAAAHHACRAAVAAGLPLEITFAPTRDNLHEAGAVIDRAASLGAFRLSSGMLMRLGTAARLWDRLEPARDDYARFFRLLRHKARVLAGTLQIAWRPWSLVRAVAAMRTAAPSTLLVLPNGRVKVCAALPLLCADLRRDSLVDAWEAYRRAWGHPAVSAALDDVVARPALVSRANDWVALGPASPSFTDAAGV